MNRPPTEFRRIWKEYDRMGKLAGLFRNPLSFLFTRSTQEERVAAYVIREHERGSDRSLTDILNDPYVRNRLTPQQRARLLDRPDVIHAIGDDIVEGARRSPERLDGRPDPAPVGAADGGGADRDVPRRHPVRLEEDDVVVGAPALHRPRHDVLDSCTSDHSRIPAATGSIRSPDSVWDCSRESQHTNAARRSTASSSSRRLASLAPMAHTTAPGRSHSPSSTGSFEVVAVTTTSASSAAPRADSAGSAPVRSQNEASRSPERQYAITRWIVGTAARMHATCVSA